VDFEILEEKMLSSQTKFLVQMSDLKEETTVDNNNEQPDQNVEETTQDSAPKPIDPSLQGVQLFYEQNKKMVQYVGGGILAIAAVFIFFKFYYLPDKETEAANEIFWAQAMFDRDSFRVAVNGGPYVMAPDGQKQMMGFEAIADDYGITKTGNLANYYAGICHLRMGSYEKAIERLQKFSGSDPFIAPIALGATGDAYMELNKLDEAVKFYLKAAEEGNNNFVTPFYLKKAGFAYEQKANYTEAINIYERIQKEYARSNEGKEIEREIARVKALGNL
jgi:tetratricopeptide (TPR) repeat protein